VSTLKNQVAPAFRAHPLLSRVQGWADKLTLGLNVIGTLLIVAIMVLVNSDVIGRSVFNSPISGVPELVSMSIVAIVFLQVAQTFRKGRLTRTEAVLGWIEKKSVRLRAFLELLFCVGTILILLQLLFASYPLFKKSWVRNTFEGTIGDFTAPIWPVKLVILIGCVALLLQLILSAVGALQSLWQGNLLEKGGSSGRL
jgi:TRAP-type mannitol/chloroaromatic compound transport system permease small subunit